MSIATRAAGATLGVAAIAAIVAGSHARLVAVESADAVMRVSWSARPERIETCVRVGPEELAKLPVHMRRELVCEGTTARYRLEVTRDGALLDSVSVRGGGLRHDREVYVAREIRVPPGTAALRVRFVRLDSSAAAASAPRAAAAVDTVGRSAGARETRETRESVDAEQSDRLADRGSRERDERRRRQAEAIPPLLVLDTIVPLVSRSVILVTYDPILRKLVIKRSPE